MTKGSSFSYSFELDRHLLHIQDEIVFGKYLQRSMLDIYYFNCNMTLKWKIAEYIIFSTSSIASNRLGCRRYG